MKARPVCFNGRARVYKKKAAKAKASRSGAFCLDGGREEPGREARRPGVGIDVINIGVRLINRMAVRR